MRHINVKQQRGATLIIALIMLVLLTLFAITAMNASNTSIKIASNTQMRTEALAAAQQEIDKAMSVNFTLNPASVAGDKTVDVNNDGQPDYLVRVTTPSCIGIIPIKTSDLDITKPSDVACFGSGTAATTGIVAGGKAVGGGTGNSLCSNSQWEIGARAIDPNSGATHTTYQGIGVSEAVHQGVAVRVKVGTAC
jgi:type II secretory pathway pseudopilin PulG